MNPTMLSISFIEPHLELFGGIRRVLELSNSMIDLGHNVTIFHSDGRSCQWMDTKATILSYDEALRQEHEILIFNDPNLIDYQLAKRAEAKLKIFYVLELYEMDLLRGFNLRLLKRNHRKTLLMKLCLKSPFIKLSNATWLVDWLRNNLDINSKLLLGGVNQEIFYPVPIEKKPLEMRLLCSGDPRQRKGTLTIYEAVKIAQEQEPELVLDTYYGQGIPQEQMAAKYSSADIFVDGQHQAGWNNPVAEAMACKVPVVCTDIGGVRDFAINEQTALLVPVHDPQKMAEAILRLAGDPDLRNSLSENGYQKIIQFDWKESALRLENILSSLLHEDKDNWSNQYHDEEGMDIRILNQILLFVSYFPIPGRIRKKTHHYQGKRAEISG